MSRPLPTYYTGAAENPMIFISNPDNVVTGQISVLFTV